MSKAQELLDLIEKDLGKTKSGKPILDKDHQNYKLLHDMNKTQKELGDHLKKVFPEYSKEDHEDASAKYLKRSNRAKDDDDKFMYKWIGQIHKFISIHL